MSLHGTKTGNPTDAANASARRRGRVKAAKVGHRPVDIETLWKRDRGRCCVCGHRVPLELATVEHLKPVSRGGEHVGANLAVSHARCNSRKGARTLAELRARQAAQKARGLRRTPLRPKPKPLAERAAKRRLRAEEHGRRDPRDVFVDEVPDADLF